MPDFRWNPKTRIYFKDGRPVKPETLRLWVSEVLERTRGEMAKVTEGFMSGGMNRAAWMLQMKGLVSRSHSALWMLAQGGRDAMDAKQWGSVGARIKVQVNDHLRGFERDLANARAGTDAQIIARAQQYAAPLHATYQAAILMREKEAGVMRVARVTDADSQSCEDCPDLAGEYDIDEVPEIGLSSCGAMCRCEIVSLERVAA